MFIPLFPYGLNPANGFPIGNYWNTQNNNGYNCAPTNGQYFLGWTNLFNVINAMVSKASGVVNVYELEFQQEMNVLTFTAQMRLIYDNSMSQSAPPQYVQTIGGTSYVNVLSALRSLMTANGFDAGRAAYSSPWSDSSVVTENCGDVYGDYARNDNQDNLTQAINGGPIGMPNGWFGSGSLVCGGIVDSTMLTSPIYSTQPDIVDMHIYPKVAGETNTDAMVQQSAAIDYGDVPNFLAEAGLTSAAIVIGETYGGTLSPVNLGTAPQPNYCWLGAYQSPSGAPSDNVAGFNNEGVSNPLSNFTVTFRPWMELEDPSGQCFAYGSGPGTPGNYQSLNYGGQGPYTPTHQ